MSKQLPIESIEPLELDVDRAHKQFESVLAFVDHLQREGMDVTLNISCSIGINPQRPKRKRGPTISEMHQEFSKRQP